MRVGDLVKWQGAGLIAKALNHPQTAVSGLVVEISRDGEVRPGRGLDPTVTVALVHGGIEFFSASALEVVNEDR